MKSVLVIDDDEGVRGALKRVLERAGYAVRTVASGEEGLRAIRQQRPDVVITDIIMPKMDGAVVIKAIASEFPGIRVIAISGGGNVGVADYKPESITTTAYLSAAKQAGAHVVLTKPFETSDMIEAIEPAPDGRGGS